MSRITWQISTGKVLIQTQMWPTPNLFSTILFLRAVLEAYPGVRGARQGPCICVCACVHANAFQLCLILCNPLDCNPLGPSVREILQNLM